MNKKPKNIELNEEEQEIEKNLDSLEPLSGWKKSRIVSAHRGAAKKFIKKNKRITIRVYDADLEQLKSMAQEEGLNYQTFITSILHKVCTGKMKNISF
jgi:predicted DNA binding CopG/RHH family protein